MKLLKKATAIVFALIIIGSVFSLCAHADTYNGITYSNYGEGLRLTNIDSTVAKNLVIPQQVGGKTVLAIKEEVFKDSEITSVIIPGTVKNIGKQAFFNCAFLEKVTFLSSVENVTLGTEVFSNCTKLSNLTLPTMLETIPQSAFNQCNALTAVSLPATLKTIGKQAFTGCTSIGEVNIPAGVTSIGDKAFYNCTSVTYYDVDSGNTAYKSIDGMLYTADGKTLVQYPVSKSGTVATVPDGTEIIGIGAFGFSNVTKITLPESVKEISDDAFAYSESLTLLNIPEGTETLGSGIVYRCTSLKEITVPGTVKTWENAFKAASIEKAVISSGVTSIDENAFCDCSSLTRVIIPSTVTEIGNGAFYNCASLGKTGIPASVNTIAANAFNGTGTSFSICTESGCYAEEYAEGRYSLEYHTEGEQVIENEVPATCIATGSYDLVATCSKCGGEISRETKTTPVSDTHNPDTAVIENEIPATCKAGGSYERVVRCKDCKKVLSRETVNTEATDHVPGIPEKTNEVKATCTEKGSYDSVVKCIYCDKVLETEKVETPLGKHTPGPWEIVTPATAVSEGKRERRCTVCGAVTATQTIPMIDVYIGILGIPDGNETTIHYKADITFHAFTQGIGEGEKIKWYVDGSSTPSGEGPEFKVADAEKSFTVQAKIIGADGVSVVSQSVVETVNVKPRSILNIIVSFILRIFGMLDVDQR